MSFDTSIKTPTHPHGIPAEYEVVALVDHDGRVHVARVYDRGNSVVGYELLNDLPGSQYVAVPLTWDDGWRVLPSISWRAPEPDLGPAWETLREIGRKWADDSPEPKPDADGWWPVDLRSTLVGDANPPSWLYGFFAEWLPIGQRVTISGTAYEVESSHSASPGYVWHKLRRADT